MLAVHASEHEVRAWSVPKAIRRYKLAVKKNRRPYL